MPVLSKQQMATYRRSETSPFVSPIDSGMFVADVQVFGACEWQHARDDQADGRKVNQGHAVGGQHARSARAADGNLQMSKQALASPSILSLRRGPEVVCVRVPFMTRNPPLHVREQGRWESSGGPALCRDNECSGGKQSRMGV